MKTALLFTLLLLLSTKSYSQATQALYFTTNPHSVSSFGSGWQGVSSLTPDDAMVYNPARLTLNNNTRLSFYRNPNNMAGFRSTPYTNSVMTTSIKNVGSFGISYEYWYFGEFVITNAESPKPIGKFKSYDGALAIGYARELSEQLSLGAQLRYAYNNFSPDVSASGIFLSLGLLYVPEIMNKRLSLGFSLMNLGTAVKYDEDDDVLYDPAPQSDPPPSKLNAGISYIAVKNPYFSLPLDLSISKPFDKQTSDEEAKSSFKTLFTDWKYFPNDAALHTGVSFLWEPLNLGNDFSYFQQFFIGNYSSGVKTGLYNYYTHGANIGITYKGVAFTMGYAGVFHNVRSITYLPWVFPFETFQFSLQINNGLIFNKNIETDEAPLLDKFILSAGGGGVIRMGKAKGTDFVAYENSPVFLIEGAFYFDNDNALVSSLQYNSIPVNLKPDAYIYYPTRTTKFETFSFFSSYRYHLLDKFFIQGGLGIYRENLVLENTYPKYSYRAIFQLTAGLPFEFLKPVIITPQVDYNNIIMPASGDAPRIQGYSQFNFLIKVGYLIF